MTLSANFAARFRSWLIMTMVMPVFAESFFRNAVTYIWCLMSRLEVGSSRISILGSCTSPLAMDTF
ncbi:MAG: hypothetical protein J5674_03105 [Candidatus Methanomethylophilaceae archaeon]|nr:hypothetical protein [Candidatus Methanomethylophilaceae archaeon]